MAILRGNTIVNGNLLIDGIITAVSGFKLSNNDVAVLVDATTLTDKQNYIPKFNDNSTPNLVKSSITDNGSIVTIASPTTTISSATVNLTGSNFYFGDNASDIMHVKSKLYIYDATDISHYIHLDVPAISANYTVTLPAVTGTLAALNLTQTWSAIQTHSAGITTSNAATINQIFTGTTTHAHSIAANSLTSGNALNISSTSATRTADSSLIKVVSSGNSAVALRGIDSSISNGGTSNIAYYASASGATTNYSFYGNAGILYNLGPIGVGTLAPNKALEIVSTSAQARLSYDGSNYTDFFTTSAGQLQISPTGGIIHIKSADLLLEGDDADVGIRFLDTGNETWSIKSNQSNTSALTFAYSADPDTTPYMVILSGGNVGIGNIAPTYKLDVTGTFRATGDTSIDGTLTVTQVDGNASTATKAYVTNDTTTNGNMPLLFASGSGSNQDIHSNVALAFNPAAKTLTLADGYSFVGALSSEVVSETAVNLNGEVLYSIPYQSAISTTSYINPNTISKKMWLSMVGTGSEGTAPAWSYIDRISANLSVDSGINVTMEEGAGIFQQVHSSTTATASFNILHSGAKIASFDSFYFQNIATSSTAGVTKRALRVASTGTWNGATAINQAIYSQATGGTTNYSFYGDGGTFYNKDAASFGNAVSVTGLLSAPRLDYIDTPTYTDDITSYSPVEIIGDGYEADDTPIDVSANVVDGSLELEQKGLTITNLVVNGKPTSDNLAGWTASGGTLAVDNGILTLTSTGTDSPILATCTLTGLQANADKIFINALFRLAVGAGITSLEAIYDGSTAGTNVPVKIQSNPVINTWYEAKAIVTTPNDFTGTAVIKFLISGIMAIGDKLQIDVSQGVTAVNLTALGLSTITDTDILAKLLQYVDGTKNVGKMGVRVVGKNNFDINKFVTLSGNSTYYRNDGGDLIQVAPDYRTGGIYPVFATLPAGTYKWTVNTANIVNWNMDANTGLSNSSTFTLTKLTRVASKFYAAAGTNLGKVQLELGSIATTYEPYQEQLTFLPSIGNSLPNGIADSIKTVADGWEHTKRVSDRTLLNVEYFNTLQTNADNVVVYGNANFQTSVGGVEDSNGISFEAHTKSPNTNLDAQTASDISRWTISGTRRLGFVFASGTTLAQAKTALANTYFIYQLAPASYVTTHYDLPHLTSGKTIHRFAGDKKTVQYGTGVEFDENILSVLHAYKTVDGKEVEVEATFAGNIVTIDNTESYETVTVAVEFDVDAPLGELIYSAPTNQAATTESASEGIRRLNNHVYNLSDDLERLGIPVHNATPDNVANTLVMRDNDGNIEVNTLTTHESLSTASLFLEEDASSTNYLEIYNNSGLSANRRLTINVNNADRTVSLAGNLTLANNFTTAGNFALTLTSTADTSVTLPTSGTLATTSNTETFTNKTLTSPDINGGTVDAITSLTVANNVDIGSYQLRASTFRSDVATGTAPFTVASTTKVTNLNADLLDGMNTSTANTASTIVYRDGSGNFAAGQVTMTKAQVNGDVQIDATDGTDGFVLRYNKDAKTLDFVYIGV